MKFFKIKSYAKINLSLNITGKLNSKLHKVESIVSFVNLYDLIYLRPINSNNHRVYFKGKFAKGIKQNNSISLLLKLLDKKNLLNNKRFEIKIVKNIPQQSGMGGGSMNAASLIDFFLKKRFFKLSKKELINLTYLLGSDVILGIVRKNTVMSSNGKLRRFNKKIGFYVLITKPNFGCSTKLIYSNVKNFSKSKYNNPSQKLLTKHSIVNSNNELEQISFKKYPKLKKIKLFLTQFPNIMFVRMSGSGSSIVAYFHSKKAVDLAAEKFKKKFKSYWCITSKTI
ncbi:MAG: 4-diphosphocytidyl-2-C-methyl-D-erythritol kinase [Pelagibacterales bacterium]|nr:4-diphosphocytidyl-2-C-methyl-D-erythritol kinase [Pelagibacterales bacterium]